MAGKFLLHDFAHCCFQLKCSMPRVQVVMHSLQDTYAFFQESIKNVHSFSAACLSICCKFVHQLQSWQIRTLRKNVPVHDFINMEIAILQAFDWCVEYVQSPTLTGILHLYGATDGLCDEQMCILNEMILTVYLEEKLLQERIQEPYAWALACLESSNVVDADTMKRCRRRLLRHTNEECVRKASELLLHQMCAKS